MPKQNQTEKQSQENSQEFQISDSRKAYMKYSGMGMTLAAYIVIGVLIGTKLDAYYENEVRYWTAGLSIFFLFLGMYASLRDILFPPKKDEKSK